MMKVVRIGGVPEHFNYAWYIALKEHHFRNQGIDLQWVDCHGGTGEMVQGLQNNKIDMAVVLTEGIVKAISEGNPSKIVQTFVQSPLVWGIHVATNAPYKSLTDLKQKYAAISRIGSGSHLMAYVHAKQMGWNPKTDLRFNIVNHLQGGIEALQHGRAHYFLWEKFTTKPYVDQGIFRRIGECPTPWPCFVIAARNSFIEHHAGPLKLILNVINGITKGFKNISNIDSIISERYGLKNQDVIDWLNLTEWSLDMIDKSTLSVVQNQLLELNLISNRMKYTALVNPL